jgi:hypothetical protein
VVKSVYKKLRKISNEIMGDDVRDEDRELSQGESMSESVFMTKDFLNSLSLNMFRVSISKENIKRN